MCAILRVVAYFLSVTLLHSFTYVHCLCSLCVAPTFHLWRNKEFLDLIWLDHSRCVQHALNHAILSSSPDQAYPDHPTPPPPHQTTTITTANIRNTPACHDNSDILMDGTKCTAVKHCEVVVATVIAFFQIDTDDVQANDVTLARFDLPPTVWIAAKWRNTVWYKFCLKISINKYTQAKTLSNFKK